MATAAPAPLEVAADPTPAAVDGAPSRDVATTAVSSTTREGRNTIAGRNTIVSMEDVARRAGVSTATVSRTLRGLPHVSEETRQRVLLAAAELSYVVSPIASRLASGRTQTVGVLVPHASRWYFAQVVFGVESVLRETGLDLLLYNVGDHPARERFFDVQPLRRRVDAVLVVAMPLTEGEIDSLGRLGVPVVSIGAATPGAASVRIDDVAAVRGAVEHLIQLGHRRIGMVSTYADQEMWLPVAHDRRAGYLTALAAAGLPADPALVVSVPFGLAGGAWAMDRLLALPDPPTAIFAESDELAFGALAALRRAGLTAPEHMSIIGFDDHEISPLLDLTTVRQLVFEQGAIGAGLLTRALADPDCDRPDMLLPTQLIVRTSTARRR
jgi:DNA-binding LacI/PurR family transcriptional regulator